MWVKVNNVWGDYKWKCIDTGIEPLKKGFACWAKRGTERLYYKDENNVVHEMKLTNIETGETITPTQATKNKYIK